MFQLQRRSGFLLAGWALLFWLVANVVQAQLAAFSPLKLNPQADPALAAKADGAAAYRLDRDELLRLHAADAQDLRFTLPLPDGGKWPLHLTRSRVLTDDFRLTDEAGRELPFESGLHYRGIIHGRPDCWASVSFTRRGLMAVVVTPEGAFNLGPQGGNTESYVLFNDRNLKIAPPKRDCHADELNGSPQKPFDPDRVMAGEFCHVITKLFVCDYQLYLDFDRSTQRVMDYVTGMYNVVAHLYDREEIMTEIARIQVYTTPDPYRGSEKSHDALFLFRDADPLRQAGNQGISLAHLLSSERLNRGGVAYLNQLCNSNTSQRTAFSEIHTTFEELPYYSWTVQVVSHEMGHNLGSPHTQNCGWPGGAIDGCVNVEGDCARPTIPSPPFKGTVMSYCHLLPGIGVDLNLGFGPLPGELVRQRVRGATCSSEKECVCNAPRVPMVTQTEADGSQATFEWTGSPGAKFFEVRARYTGGEWTDVTRVNGNQAVFTLLQPGSEIEYQVRAVCDTLPTRRESAWSRYFFTTTNNGPYCETLREETFTGEILVTDGSGPSDYRDNTSCTFEYRSQTALPVSISFTEFRTERDYDFLRVYDGNPDQGGTLLGSYSGSNLPPVLTAASGIVFLDFRSDESIIDAGWAVLLKEIPQESSVYCQGTLNFGAADGTITDGSGPNDYGNNSDCRWSIQPEGADQVRITFIEFNTEAGFDFVSVYDGSSTDSPLIGRYSGANLPPVLLTSGPSAFVTFSSDRSATAPGWHLEYEGLRRQTPSFCQGLQTRTALQDSVSDGSASANYAPNSACRWLIQPTENVDAIDISFTEFDTEANADFVSIYAGTSVDAPLVATLSGGALPEGLIVQASAALVVFTTNAETQAQGWKLNYIGRKAAEQTFCSGLQTRTAASDTVTDGSGTANYANNSDCRWLIQPPGTSRIILSVEDLDTERDRDLLRVYDGADENATLLGTFAGIVRNQQLTTTTGAAFLVFTSDAQNRSAGWRVSYNAEFAPDPVFCQGQQVRTEPTDTITDGSGAANYGNNSSCSWLIQPAGATNVRISFDSLRTESGFDFVTVYDGPTESAAMLARFSGSNRPSSVTTSQGEALVVFSSDFSNTDAGWGLRYEALFNGEPVFCRGLQTRSAVTDTITDGSADANYGPNSFCQWLIQPAGARSITISFEAFDTEASRDFVTIYAGSDVNAPVVGRYSGATLPSALQVISPVAFVVFQTDDQNQSTGWQLRYRGVSADQTRYCIGQQTATAPSAEIEDGSGGRPYGPNSDCRWLIAPPNALSLEITFLEFDLEDQFDHVWVYDGGSEAAALLGRYTGATLPSVLRTSGGQAFIVFRSDRSEQRQGWKLSYEGTFPPEPRYCDGLQIRNAAADTITDGSGPNAYYPNSACRWLIAPEHAGNVIIDFTAFDVETDADFVTVYAGPNIQAPVIGRFTGNALPSQLVTGTGTALIQFESNEAVERAGWSLRYRAEFPSCRGTQVRTARTDTITDGSLGRDYGPNSDCRWRISPAGARNIVIEFMNFATQSDTDFVSVYAGPDERAPLLGRFSGTSLPALINTRSNEALIVFRSDAFRHAAGWTLRYTGEIPSCSGQQTRTAPADTITDGSGSLPYGPLSDCRWLIDVPGADSLSISFERFATAGEADVLTVFDGPDATAPVLGSFSGAQLPSRLKTSTGKALIAFVTDRTEQADGWQLRYQAHFPPPPPVFCRDQQLRTAAADTITDGSGASAYGPNSDCRWLIRPSEPAAELVIEFDAFETEAGNDILRVYAGETETGEPLLTHSGDSLPERLVVEGGVALLVFTTNGGSQGAGWQLRYAPGPTRRAASSAAEDLTLYPNPTTGMLHLSGSWLNDAPLTLTVYASDGRELLRRSAAAGLAIDVNDLARGLYLLKVEQGSRSATRSFLKY